MARQLVAYQGKAEQGQDHDRVQLLATKLTRVAGFIT